MRNSFPLTAVIACVLLSLSAVSQADLVGYWTFNDSTTKDSSGNGLNGTAAGNYDITTTGKSGTAFRTQGEGGDGGKMNVALSDITAGNVSLSFWGKYEGSANWKNYAAFRYGGVAKHLQFQANGSNSVSVYGGVSGATHDLNSTANVRNSQYHHIVLTTDSTNSTAKLYIDGVESVTNNAWTLNDALNYLTLAGIYDDASRNAKVAVDEVQLYNAPLTSDQVSYIYNNPALYAATVYSRDVTADGNWTASEWTANGQTNQPWANSSAVELTATNAPTLTVDAAITANSIDFKSGSMTVAGTNAITLNGEKRIGVTAATDTATISAPLTTGFTKIGAGKLTLTNTGNTLSGGIEIQGGTVTANSTGALNGGGITLNGGALDVSAAGRSQTFSNAITIGTNGGSITTATEDYSSFASLSGSGDLTTNGYVHFNGTGGFSGNITVSSGFMRVAKGAVGTIPKITFGDGAHFNMEGVDGTIQIGQLSGGNANSSIFSTGGANYTIELGVNTVETDSATYAGVIRGASKNTIILKKVGAGTQVFTRAGYLNEGYTDTIEKVQVEGGKLIVDSVGSGGAAEQKGFFGDAAVTVSNGAILQYSKAWNTPANSSLTLDGGTMQIEALGYVNNLTLNSGTIKSTNNNTDYLRAGYQMAPIWNVTGEASVVESHLQLFKSGNYDTFTVNIAKDASLEFKNAVVGESGSYKGMNLLVQGKDGGAGTIKLNGAYVMSNLGTITFDAVKVELSGDIGSWASNGYFTSMPITIQNGANFSTSTSFTTNNTAFTLDNGTMTFLNNPNTYVSNFTLKNGSSMEGTSFRVGHQWDGNIKTVFETGAAEDVMNEISAEIQMYTKSNGSLTFEVAEKAPLLVSGKIVPVGNNATNDIKVYKTGAGVLTLANAENAMSKGIEVQAGTLQLTADGAQGTGPITIATGTILDIGAENTPTRIDFTGQSVTLGGTLSLDYFADGTHDFADFGNLVLNAGTELYIDVNGAGTSSGKMVPMFDYDSIQGAFETITFSMPGWSATFRDNQLFVYDNNSVPEPATWTLLILGALGLTYFRRKR